MQIKVAEHYGLCFGVRDALAKAEQIAQSGPVTILGELVHNPLARARLREHGAQEGSLDDLASAQTSAVLITAHGAADAQRERWKAAGFAVSDTTCPLVRKAHTALRTLVARGFHPVVIGQRGHTEVRGLIGDFPGACVVETAADLAALPPRLRYGVVSQTTQPLEKVRQLVEALRAAQPESEVEWMDTVCQPTKDRQQALHKLLQEVDAMVVVGGRNSNNTLQLVAACRAAGKPVRHVESAAELDAEWFRGTGLVGLTAGTSTLPETVLAAHRRLEAIAADEGARRTPAKQLAPAAGVP